MVDSAPVNNCLKGRKGFTLIELMVVVIVIGVLAGAAAPIYRFATNRAYGSEGKATLGTMRKSEMTLHAESNTFIFGTSEDTPTSILEKLGVDVSTNSWWTTANATFGVGNVPTSGIKAVVPPGTYVYTIGIDGKVKDIELYLNLITGTWHEYWP